MLLAGLLLHRCVTEIGIEEAIIAADGFTVLFERTHDR